MYFRFKKTTYEKIMTIEVDDHRAEAILELFEDQQNATQIDSSTVTKIFCLYREGKFSQIQTQ